MCRLRAVRSATHPSHSSSVSLLDRVSQKIACSPQAGLPLIAGFRTRETKRLLPWRSGSENPTWAVEEVTAVGLKEGIVTPRLQVRPPTEADRVRFTELFCDDAFMVFSGKLTEEAAHRRFDHMLAICEVVPFAKQPILERASGVVVGYTGVDYFTFEDEARLEWGYRLVPESRGMGYATEASQALLARAAETYSGELVAMIDPNNHASERVCRKLGFAFLKRTSVEGDVRNLYTLVIGGTAQ